MKQTISVVLLSLLLVSTLAGDDINVEKKKASGPKVGGWEEIDVTNFKNT